MLIDRIEMSGSAAFSIQNFARVAGVFRVPNLTVHGHDHEMASSAIAGIPTSPGGPSLVRPGRTSSNDGHACQQRQPAQPAARHAAAPPRPARAAPPRRLRLGHQHGARHRHVGVRRPGHRDHPDLAPSQLGRTNARTSARSSSGGRPNRCTAIHSLAHQPHPRTTTVSRAA